MRLHIGATEVLGRVRVLDEPAEIPAGGGGLAQLRLEAPVVALHGDRFILRSYSPQQTIAGGVIVDPFAAKHRGKDMAQTRRLLRTLMEDDRVAVFRGLVSSSGERGLRLADIGAATGWTNDVLASVATAAQAGEQVIDAGGVFLVRESFDRLSSMVLDELDRHHKREPLARGMLRETLREKVFAHSFPELFNAVIARLEAARTVVSEKDIIRAGSHSVGLSEQDAQMSARIEQVYRDAGVESPSIDDVMKRAGVTIAQRTQARKILQLLVDGKKLVRIQNEMFMHAAVIDGLRAKLINYASKHEPQRLIDVPAFKELAGVSRKYAIPLLEYFDREQVTRRTGDKRVILKPRV
jgi:selenocysteine-specific elongation factor